MIDYILRFSLDRIFACVDTAFPDSGDVQAPGGPSRERLEGPGAHGEQPGS